MRQSAMKYSVGPFIILTLIYFIVGFLTTVNGQFQGPLNIAFLSEADELRNTLTTMISFFFLPRISGEQRPGGKMGRQVRLSCHSCQGSWNNDSRTVALQPFIMGGGNVA